MSRLFFTLFIASLINMFLLPEAFAVDVEEVESSEDAAITEDDAVEPVIVCRLVCTVSRATVKTAMELVMDVTSVFNEVFSVAVQVTEAPEISFESVLILSLAGLSLARVVICLDLEMISEHFVAVALTCLPDDDEPDSVFILSLAVVISFLLVVRLLAFATSFVVLLPHAKIAVMVSSSNFLQILKLPVHSRSCLVIAFEDSEILQFLSAIAVLLSVEFVQHEQAADTVVLFRQNEAMSLKVVTSLLHSLTRVVFGLGKFAGLQDALIFISQPWRTLVRFVSCFAPAFV